MPPPRSTLRLHYIVRAAKLRTVTNAQAWLVSCIAAPDTVPRSLHTPCTRSLFYTTPHHREWLVEKG